MIVKEAMKADIGYVHDIATVGECSRAIQEFKFSSIPVVETVSQRIFQKKIKKKIPRKFQENSYRNFSIGS